MTRVVRTAALAAALLAGCGDREVDITILGTTDVHGHLVDYEYATDRPADHSLAQVATLVDSVRRADANVILVDSGDLLQGAPLDEYQARVGRDPVHPVIAAMNLLRYDASAIGNHEFNYGVDYLWEALGAAEFPFLAGNIVRAGTDDTVRPPYTIVERGGVRIAILGFTTPGVAVWDRTHIAGRLEFRDIVDSARRWVPRVREAGADVIVVAAHAGLGPGSTYDDPAVPEENPLARLAVEVPGIDVIFAGHTAEAIAGERVGGTLILHAGRHADHLAVARLRVRLTPVGAEVSSEGTVIPTSGVAPDSALLGVVRSAHDRTVAWLGEPIGYTPDRWESGSSRAADTPIADLIQRVQLDLTGADLSAAAMFRTDVGFGPGPITRRDILGLYVYPNTLRAIRLSGADLRDYLEMSARYFRTLPADRPINDSVPGYNYDMIQGVDYVLDLRRPAGRRVVDLRYRGAPVSPADSFTMALNSYRQSGGGGFRMVSGAPVVYADPDDIAGRIVAFVESRDTLRVSDVFEENWRLVPEEAVSRVAEATAPDANRR